MCCDNKVIVIDLTSCQSKVLYSLFCALFWQRKTIKNKKEMYTLQEKVEIIRLVGDGTRTFRQAAQEFNRRHPQHNINHKTVEKINRFFDQHGTIKKLPNQHRERERRGNQVIIDYFTNNPNSSLRDASRNLNISKSQIWKCLKISGKKPFKPKFLHTLEAGDTNMRLEYCLWLQGMYLVENPNFFKNILYTDEATFTTNGIVSSQNIRMWSEDNPHWTIECKRQYSSKINVFCGILNEKIIGPYFFNENLNSMRFLRFLQNEFTDAIDELPLDYRYNLHLQFDGAPIHNAADVRRWLDDNFPNRWIGRSSALIRWPPRSPDLTPLDFFLWGTIKNKVYARRPRTRPELRDSIIAACQSITRQQLRNVMINNRRRTEKCIREFGGLIEMDKI